MPLHPIRECPYSPNQIAQYLQHISLSPAKPSLAFLAALQRHHLSSIPFENLSLHYSPPPNRQKISLDPQDVYTKFITCHRGGYCMEQNMFFDHMLRGLGFTVHSVGARVRKRENGVPVGDFMGWAHIVNIVTFSDGARYMVDVGFGGDGPTKPLRLVDGEVTRNLGTQEMHLMYENIVSNADPRQRLWVYNIRNNKNDYWKAAYCFTEVEFLQQDFEVMSFFVNASPQSWFTTTVVAVRMLVEKHEIVGKVMLWGGDVKENNGGRTKLLMTCESEEERVEMLKAKFGIVLDKEEQEAIKGTPAALPTGEKC